VHIADIVLEGATLFLRNCTGCSARNVTLRYPTYDPEVRELNNPPVRKRHAIFKMITPPEHLPRQARDRHGTR
jgi:hypothetical protein